MPDSFAKRNLTHVEIMQQINPTLDHQARILLNLRKNRFNLLLKK